MKIEVATIPKSGIVLDVEESPRIMSDCVEGGECRQPIRVAVSVNLVGRMLVVRGKLTTTASLECNRCLKRFDYDVEVPDYTFAVQVRGDETVDLTKSIREGIILSFPMKRLCDPDCRGLCPVCGQDRNTSACNCKKSQASNPFSQLDSLKS